VAGELVQPPQQMRLAVDEGEKRRRGKRQTLTGVTASAVTP